MTTARRAMPAEEAAALDEAPLERGESSPRRAARRAAPVRHVAGSTQAIRPVGLVGANRLRSIVSAAVVGVTGLAVLTVPALALSQNSMTNAVPEVSVASALPFRDQGTSRSSDRGDVVQAGLTGSVVPDPVPPAPEPPPPAPEPEPEPAPAPEPPAPTPEPPPATQESASAQAKNYDGPCASSEIDKSLTDATATVHRALCANFPEVKTYGGYRKESGSYHGYGQAIDAMIRGETGDALAEWAIQNHEEFGIIEIIWKQRYWSSKTHKWKSMSDRGGETANHYDHVHISVGPWRK